MPEVAPPRAPKRRKKTPKIPDKEAEHVAPPPSSPEDRPVRNKRILSRVTKREASTEAPKLESDEVYRKNLAFCCADCHCDKSHPKYGQFVWSSFDSLPHLKCCHNVTDKDDPDCIEEFVWATPYEACLEEIRKIYMGDKDCDIGKFPKRNQPEFIYKKEIYKRYVTAKTQESQFYNADGEEEPCTRLHTSEDYKEQVVKRWKEIESRRCLTDDPKRRAVLLDCFAGVGTGAVCLKRLGIAVEKVIYVDIDKVARHVYRHNHDAMFSTKEGMYDDGIEHVYEYKSFEEVESNLGTFFDRHGPIDIVIGGPPCVDYSKVNANRQGYTGDQGSLMIRFGKVIRKIEKMQGDHPLFFLAENVVVDHDDLAAVRNAFQTDWDPILFDAQYVSPTRRKRHFVTNIVLEDIPFTGEDSMTGPNSCLEKGFCTAAHLVDPNKTLDKVPCIMASAYRIDEKQTLRMYAFQPIDYKSADVNQKFLGRPLTVSEREKLIGYPVAYVSKAVSILFQELLEEGVSKVNKARSHWKETLPARYCDFKGNYHGLPKGNPYMFRLFRDETDEPKFELTMAPPTSSKNKTHFTADEYAKHLIGNAYSVPVVEHLLRPLQKLFARQEYPGYSYDYAWRQKS